MSSLNLFTTLGVCPRCGSKDSLYYARECLSARRVKSWEKSEEGTCEHLSLESKPIFTFAWYICVNCSTFFEGEFNLEKEEA